MDKKRVLIVDDEPSIIQSVAKVLERKGFEITSCKNSEESLTEIRSGKFNLVIADLMMPRVSGIDLLKTVRNDKNDVPFLIITGYPSINAAVEATKLGAEGFLPKPFTPIELEEAVEKALGGKTEFQSVDALPNSEEIDVDLPFDAREVAKATSPYYVENLQRGDMAIAHPTQREVASDFCPKGQRSCKKFVKSGECKDVCPFVAKAQKNMKQVSSSFSEDTIDVDMPFSFSEVASLTSEAYALSLGRSDIVVVGHYNKAKEISRSIKILAIDDEPVVVNAIRKTYERKGFLVDTAFSSKEALSKIRSMRFDLAIVDLKLGDENGLNLISQLKKTSPETAVIVLTGYASIETAIESVKRGADNYLAKPFTPDELYLATEKSLKVA